MEPQLTAYLRELSVDLPILFRKTLIQARIEVVPCYQVLDVIAKYFRHRLCLSFRLVLRHARRYQLSHVLQSVK